MLRREELCREELCREVSVAAARVLSQHGAHRLLSSGLPSTDESFREQLKKKIAAQLLGQKRTENAIVSRIN